MLAGPTIVFIVGYSVPSWQPKYMVNIYLESGFGHHHLSYRYILLLLPCCFCRRHNVKQDANEDRHASRGAHTFYFLDVFLIISLSPLTSLVIQDDVHLLANPRVCSRPPVMPNRVRGGGEKPLQLGPSGER